MVVSRSHRRVLPLVGHFEYIDRRVEILALIKYMAGSLWLPSTTQTASRSVQSFCTAHDRDRPRYFVCCNRPHSYAMHA